MTNLDNLLVKVASHDFDFHYADIDIASDQVVSTELSGHRRTYGAF